MTTFADDHLTNDRILDAVATGKALSDRDRQHLDRCDHCRTALDQLQTDLRRLRSGSVRFSPSPPRPLDIPDGFPGNVRQPKRSWYWGLGLGTALGAAMVLVIFFGRTDRLPSSFNAGPRDRIALHAIEDPEMAEIRMLAENALPPAYQAILESLDHDPSEAEGFIDFLIPPLEDESVS